MPISQSALNRGRRAAQADMRDACRITRPSGEAVWNSETLQYEPGAPVVVYEGRCKLRRAALQARRYDVAGQLFIEKGSTLHLPMLTSVGIAKDDVGEIISSATDPELAGARFSIESAEAYANGTSRRLKVDGTQ